MTRSSRFAPRGDVNIKGFRAATARATFLCLCKETWRKESTPRLRARCVAPGSRSRRDFPKGHPAPVENAAHPCAAPFGSDPPAPPLPIGRAHVGTPVTNAQLVRRLLLAKKK